MTTQEGVCPVCEDIRALEISTKKETQEIKKQRISVEVEYSRCTECGNEFATSEQMEKNLEAYRRIYREQNDIITPEEIISLREKYGVSQKTLGKILDFGELTINSYEQGAIPSGAHNNLLKLIQNPDNFLRLLEEHKEKLSKRQQNKIDRRLKNVLQHYNVENIYYSSEVRELAHYESELNGYTCTDLSKLLCTIQLILHYAHAEIYKMALLKLLFYIDFYHFKKNAKSITGWPYARLPYGPVPEDFRRLLYQGEELGLFHAEPDEMEMGEVYKLPEGFLPEQIEAHFSENELETIREVVGKLGRYTASSLANISHQEKAWIDTEHAKLISYEFAAELKAF